jgi:hypothetical protein
MLFGKRKVWYRICSNCGKYIEAYASHIRSSKAPYDHPKSSRGKGWSSVTTLDDRGFCDGNYVRNKRTTEWKCGRGFVNSVRMEFSDVNVKLSCLRCRIATVKAVDTGAVMGRVVVFAHLTPFDTIHRVMMVREITRACDDGMTAKFCEPVEGIDDLHGALFIPHQRIPREWEEKMIFGEELSRIREALR